MIRIIGTLEDKAGKYDNLATENQTLKQEIQGYKQKEADARKQEMKEFLDKAEKEERLLRLNALPMKPCLKRTMSRAKLLWLPFLRRNVLAM